MSEAAVAALVGRIVEAGALAVFDAILNHAETQPDELQRRKVLDAALAAAEEQALKALFPEDP